MIFIHLIKKKSYLHHYHNLYIYEIVVTQCTLNFKYVKINLKKKSILYVIMRLVVHYNYYMLHKILYCIFQSHNVCYLN